MKLLKNLHHTVYILLISLLSISAFAGTEIIYYHNDLQGSPVAATDENGSILWKEDYAPYGTKLSNDMEAVIEKVGYTSHRYDNETGLVYAGARMYDPSLGRFMGIDPVGALAAVDNPVMFNRYAYGNNNPYKYVDPDGELAILAAIGIFVAVNTISLSIDVALRPDADECNGCASPSSGIDVGSLAVSLSKLLGKGASKIVPKGTGKGMNNPKVKAAAARGREAHKEFAERVKQKPGWKSEKTITGPNGEKLRPDALTPSGRPVELKPNTPSGRRQGARQIEKYKEATGTNGRVVYYDP